MFFFKQKTAYEMRISDWSSDVCSSDLAFDPDLRAWVKSKPADVDFVRYPNSLGHPQGLLHSRAFYTAMALGVFDTMHVALFDAIHKDGNPLNSERSEEHTSELQSLMRISYAVFCLNTKKNQRTTSSYCN